MSKIIEGTFLEHLDELRRRLWTMVIAFFACAAISVFFSDRLLEWVSFPVRSETTAIYFFTPSDAFTVKIKLAMLAGVFLSSPVIFSQFWSFVSPAMHAHERKVIAPLVIVTSGLFMAGALFAFFKVIPVTLHFLLSMQTEWMRPMISASEYLSFLTMMSVAFGLAFNSPVFILIPVALGILNTRVLNQFHRQVVVLIFVLAAILTPGPDIASQLLLAIPLLILFELTLIASFFTERILKKKKQAVVVS